MRHGQLAEYFVGVGAKQLSAVDAEPKSSNQHEVGTTAAMRTGFLGADHQRKFDALYFWLGGEESSIQVEGWATHYDARRGKPRAAEWRLYYPSNSVTKAMEAEDTLFLALDRTGKLWFIVAPRGSTVEGQLSWLFGVYPAGGRFVSRDFEGDERELDFASKLILEGLGVELEEPDADRLDTMIDQFGTSFPSTASFSQYARDTLSEVDAINDPDGTLVAWLEHEEALFRRLERRIVAARLEAGFVTPEGTDVDGFISFSLSVQNRRKSRMGHSLEHHMAAVMTAQGVSFERGASTEHNHRPDFLLPSLAVYEAAAPGDTGLFMLGAKSTCKDRWRQVLAEADKIPRKHLLTLEPGISKPQTDQMSSSGLQLVVPAPIQQTYSESQQEWLWSFGHFLAVVKET